MGTDEEKQQRGFKVEDRRRFSETGEIRPEVAESGSDTATAEAADEGHLPPSGQPHPALEINFATFLLSLSTQALAHLGEIPDPVNHNVQIDLGAAKQLIDIMGILKDKTKGNLDQGESALLDGVLYDLRLKYVERARGSSPRN
jgi:hypothetical protein